MKKRGKYKVSHWNRYWRNKNSVTLGKIKDSDSIELKERLEFATICGDNKYVQTLEKIEELSNKMLKKFLLSWEDIAAVGISCGGT